MTNPQGKLFAELLKHDPEFEEGSNPRLGLSRYAL